MTHQCDFTFDSCAVGNFMNGRPYAKVWTAGGFIILFANVWQTF